MLPPSRRERRSEHSREPFLLAPRRRPFTAGGSMNGRWVILLVAGIAALAALAWYMEKRAARSASPAGRDLSTGVAAAAGAAGAGAGTAAP